MFKVLSKYLQTQNILAPVVWIGILANGMNVLFNWVLIFVLDWGIHGAPWATTLTRTAEFAFILGYLYWKKKDLQSIWPKVEREYLTLKVLRPFWKLAISGALSVSAEAWSFEISTILAGFVGSRSLGIFSVLLLPERGDRTAGDAVAPSTAMLSWWFGFGCKVLRSPPA